MRTLDPEKQEAKRRHIMDAAIRCFGKNGFHGTSTNQICAEAGMSPGNLFHYFPSKQALIAAIIESEHALYAARFAELRAEPDAFVALEKIARAVLDQCSNPLHARLWLEIAAESAANEEIGQTMAACIASYQKDLAALVRRGQAAGQIAADLKPKDVAMWLLAMSDGFAVQMLGRGSDSLAKHTEVLVPLVRRLLMPQSGGRTVASAPRKTAVRQTSGAGAERAAKKRAGATRPARTRPSSKRATTQTTNARRPA
ncbi:MAG: TetR/AcrR family transcriptional regulator [Brachymonas sp.]|nr:TetR/AcrR family transcriptional regulator [Brachymonas sp.]